MGGMVGAGRVAVNFRPYNRATGRHGIMSRSAPPARPEALHRTAHRTNQKQ